MHEGPPYPGKENKVKTFFPHSFHFLFQSPPYSVYRDSSKRLTGNDVFEGYAIDLIKEIAEILSKSPKANQPTSFGIHTTREARVKKNILC